jgi:acetyl esterase/lipase
MAGMSKEQRDALDHLLRNGPLDIGGDPAEQREIFTRMLTARPLPDDVSLTPGTLGDVPVLSIDIAGAAADGVLLWFHGGVYVLGSARTSAGLASDLARRASARVVSVDYRLAPEHPFPAALDDAVAVCQGLLADGTGPSRIAVVGESAGAGLAAAALVRLRDEGVPLPAAAVLFSPYADLTLSGPSMTGKADLDPAFRPEAFPPRVADYAGPADPADGFISPVFADLTGLPPLLIQAGTYEVLLDDAIRLAARAAACDVEVRLEVTPRVPHLFQAFAATLDEGDGALRSAAGFLRGQLRAPAAAEGSLTREAPGRAGAAVPGQQGSRRDQPAAPQRGWQQLGQGR